MRLRLPLLTFSGIFIIAVLTGCAPSENPDSDTLDEATSVTSISLSFEDITGEQDNAVLWLEVGDERIYVDEVQGATTSAAVDAPPNAEASAVAWWAGMGFQYYVDNSGENIKVYRGWDGEERAADGSMQWELLIDYNPATWVIPTLSTGRLCFSFSDESTFVSVDLEVMEDGSVIGSTEESTSNYDLDIYTYSLAEFSGSMKNGVLTLDQNFLRKDDENPSRSIWPITSRGMEVNDFELTSCDVVASLCAANERAFFSCPLDGEEDVVSLCGPFNLTRSQGYLQYRRGSLNGDITRFPLELESSIDAFEIETVMYSGGWDTRVQFTLGEERFQFFDQAIKISMSEKDFSSGITTIAADGSQSDQICPSETTPFGSILLGDLMDIVQEGEFMDF